jgi:hypothetical protein
MADKRKRAAPTIDLKATEVPEPKPELKPAAETVAAREQAAPSSQPPPPPPRSDPPPAADTGPPQQDFIKTIAMPLAAGFAGALLGGAIIWGLSPRSTSDGGQIVALRKQVQELQNRPAAAPDTHAIEALRTRLGKIEQDVVNLPPGDNTVAERLTAADGAMKSLGIALTALNKRNDDAAANAKQAEDRAAAAEKAVGQLRDSVQSAKQQQASATDKAARLALSAAALRDAVVRGAPYKDELAQVKALGASDASIASIAAFAATGLPTAQALARDLNALIPALVKAAGVQGAPSGFLDRLQANASKLVRINPVDTPQGDKAADAVARIEVAAAHADIAAALADIGKLPEQARRPAADWAAKAAAREKVIAAARSFASDTARGLSSGLAK